ncbi:MAG: chitobiase/beta-hexosaminidase C-terminal domain-containing protein, partial [Candidatus Syntrophosphaera sp.]|nr:chitobiase/beta-hexosaminidase C-terminal domain-containing protein [Candidatus Syntrophosphaera sp.]
MKKAIVVMLVMMSAFALLAQMPGLAALQEGKISPELIQAIEASNRTARNFSFNFSDSPYNLPDSVDIADPQTGLFYEDLPWTKDFTRHINNPDELELSLSFYSTPEHFSVTQPDPENPLVLQFQPIPANWYGSELLILIATDVRTRTEAIALIRLNVTSVPDPPIWSGLPPDNAFYTNEETPLLINFQDYVSCVDSEPTAFELFVTPAPYPIDVSQEPTPTGHLVTFTPQQDYNGTAIYEITAVDSVSNAYSSLQIQVIVLPVNDPPQIMSHQPEELTQYVDQGQSIVFSVEVFDVEDDPLSHTWSLSGLQNGIPYSNVVSTSPGLEYAFNLPGTHIMDYEVSDGEDSDSLSWTIIVSPAGPLFDPLGGTYTQAVNVALAPPAGFDGAVIHYTLDGTPPDEFSPVYASPIEIPALADEENQVTVQAFFIHPDYPPSQTVSQTYVITGTVSPPVFDPPGGLYYAPVLVSLTSSNPGASIYYTTDGTAPEPGETGTMLYEQPILVPGETVTQINAVATRPGWLDSGIAAQTYEVTGTVSIQAHAMLPAPLPDGEFFIVEYGEALAVEIGGVIIDPADGELYYTLDNSLPGPENPNAFLYASGNLILLANPTWITLRAVAADWLPSETFSYYYDVRSQARIEPFANGTVFDPAPGYSTIPLTVSISTNTAPGGASIYFTTDGSDPVVDPLLLYTEPVLLAQTATLKAMAHYPGIYPSIVYSGDFLITGTVDAPAFDPAPGSYPAALDLSISTLLEETAIYYTLDGSEPSDTSPASYLYSGPVALGIGQHYVRARAYKEFWATSAISEGYYNIGILPAPVFDLAAGLYYEPIVVHLSVPSHPDALIYYTTDGSDPSVDSNLYNDDDGIPLGTGTSATIKAIAVKTGWVDSEISTRSYQVTGTVATPYFTPDGGVYPSATTVTIATATPEALIRYTLDGEDPTETNGTVYTGPVTIGSSATLKARAWRMDWLPSEVYGAVYTIFGTVGDPVFTPGAGTYTAPVNVYISVNPPDATIYYTTDGSEPSSSNGTEYLSGTPINIASDTLLRAIGVKAGWNPSAVASAQYYITGTVSTPVFNPPSGQYAATQLVSISAIPTAATIIYTLDGTEPTLANGIVYAAPIQITATTIVKAFAHLDGWNPSAVATANYVINGPVGTPVISPAAGYYGSAQTVSISAYPAAATIRYTLDGTIPSPSNGQIYAAPFAIEGHTIVRAYAYLENWLDSDLATSEYFFVVANPVLTPPAGTYADAQTVSISVSTAGASISYTLDGSEPGPENGTLYAGPVTISTSTTVKAIAYRADWISSNVITQFYQINGPVADPLFTVPTGNYYAAFSVGITTLPTNAQIYYTTNGSDPSPTNGTLYAGPVQVNQNMVLKARAYLNNWLPSNVSTAVYDLFASPVSFNPAGGTYAAVQSVSLGTATPSATISYTTDGSDPVPGVSPVFNPANPITVDQDLTIKALASRANWHPSVITSAAYVIDIPLPTVETPEIQPPSGVYNVAQNVTMSTATPNAMLIYTTNGSDPTLTNGTIYDGPFMVSDNVLIKARGFRDGYNPSLIASVQYIIVIPIETVATPTFSPSAGIYNEPIQVTISTMTPDATIRYTLDGTEPSETIGTVYTGPINISQTVTVKAIAYKTGMNTSLISNASYVIDIIIPVVAAPMFSLPSGTYYQAIDVAISTTTENASIRYTTDGSLPSATNGILYTAPIHIPGDSNLFIQAIAYRDGWTPSTVVSANYTVTGTVADVSFAPSGGIYTQATAVVLTTTTLGASIRYTLDGSTPTEASNLYSTAIIVPLNTTQTITARAFKTGWLPSAVTQQTYTVTGQVSIDPPVFTPAAGIYQTAQSVVLSTNTVPAGATVRYTTDGSTPTETSPVYSAPINVPMNTTTTIKAVAFLDNWLSSQVYEASYTITGQIQLPAQVFNPPAGTYQTAQSIVLNTATTPAGSTLRYTLDGSVPTENSPAYTAPIQLGLNSTTTISVKAFLTNWIPSETATATYVITGQVVFQTPVFTPPPGIYNSPQSIVIADPIPNDATVRYTTDGSEPTAASAIYTAPIELAMDTNTTIKVKAFKTDWTPSQTQTGVYTITGQASIAAPVFTPPPDTYQTAQMLSINTQTVPDGAQIRYTLDGSEPTATSTLYTAPIPLDLNSNYEVRVRAFAANWTPSIVYVGYYTITGTVVIPDPVFTPPAGTYTTNINVILNTQTVPAGAILRYTLYGVEPDESSPQYTGPIELYAPMQNTIKVKAFKENWIPSQTYSAEYILTGQMQLMPPYLSPAPGIYTSPISVSSVGGTNPTGGTIRYTTDGSDPTEDSPIFDTPIEIGLNTIDFTIKFRAFQDGWIPSVVRTGIYSVTGQVTLAEFPFAPAPGTYTSAQSVVLEAPVLPDVVVIRYTLDGSEPTQQSAAYTVPIQLPAGTVSTLKIKGFAEGWIPSETTTGIYNITGTVSPPLFNPPGGTYGSPVNVVISSATEEAEIRYTLDGSPPTEESTLYTAPIAVPHFTQNLEIRAKAFKTDWETSPERSEVYSILTSPVNLSGFTYAGYIRLLWTLPPASRALQGFNVYRREFSTAQFTRINDALVNSQVDNYYYYDDFEIAMDVSYEYYVTAVYDGVE